MAPYRGAHVALHFHWPTISEHKGDNMLRIGLLTSGGDCQALNATMRGIVKTLENNCKDGL